jgi:hypothetical protein
MVILSHYEQQPALKYVALVSFVSLVSLASHQDSARSIQAKRQSCRIVKGGYIILTQGSEL